MTAASESRIEKVTPDAANRPGPRGGKPRASRSKIPDGARKPQDHQPAKTDVVPSSARTIVWGTKPGPLNEETGERGEREPAEYEIDPAHFDDIDFMESMIEMGNAATDGERSAYAFLALRQLLGDKQWSQYKQNLRDPETGRGSYSDTVPFFNHVMTEFKQGNS